MKKIAVDHNAVDKGLKRKINAEGEGEVIQFIARLVAKGYSQVTSRDFSESFSPVMKVKSIWII